MEEFSTGSRAALWFIYFVYSVLQPLLSPVWPCQQVRSSSSSLSSVIHQQSPADYIREASRLWSHAYSSRSSRPVLAAALSAFPCHTGCTFVLHAVRLSSHNAKTALGMRWKSDVGVSGTAVAAFFTPASSSSEAPNCCWVTMKLKISLRWQVSELFYHLFPMNHQIIDGFDK